MKSLVERPERARLERIKASPRWAGECRADLCPQRTPSMRGESNPPAALALLGGGAFLPMPRLGEAVEPEHATRAQAWWRGVDTMAQPPQTEATATLPKAMSWPID